MTDKLFDWTMGDGDRVDPIEISPDTVNRYGPNRLVQAMAVGVSVASLVGVFEIDLALRILRSELGVNMSPWHDVTNIVLGLGVISLVRVVADEVENCQGGGIVIS